MMISDATALCGGHRPFRAGQWGGGNPLRHHSRLLKNQLQNASAIALVVLLLTCAVIREAAGAVSDDLAGPLRAIASAADAGRVLPASVSRLVKLQGGLVQVEILFRTAQAAQTTNLAAYGGRVEIAMDRRVQGWLPPTCLDAVADLPQVAQVRLPVRPCSFQAPVSQGVQLTGATAMHANGITGAGVRVAVVDSGFGAGSHGTAVAAVVADMAPGATIENVTAATELAVEQAINYVRDNGFDIAVMSMGVFGGPFDGTHSMSQKINAARASGVLWVNAAGNHAQRHYEGDWTDANGDRFHEWSGGDRDMDLNLSAGAFEAYLSWFETAGTATNHDYDLVLFDATGAEVARSGVTQNGDDPPAELLVAYVPAAGVYSLRIERMSPDVIPADDRFQLFLPYVDVEERHRVAQHSLAIPAEASGSFTIGATRGSTLAYDPVLPIDTIEPFSSRGPSLTGLIKPDMVGPDVVNTVVAGYSPFAGTSAAAPHVAGGAALLLSEDSARTAAMLAGSLKNLAVKSMLATDPSGTPIPDSTYGYGRLRLRVGTDSTAPQISISFPRNGDTITVSMPTVVATITDIGIGVDPSSIEVSLDGNIVTGWNYRTATGLLTYVVGTALTRTGHTITIDAQDYDGNAATTAVSNFRVAAPSISAGLHLISLPYAGLIDTDPSLIFGIPFDQVQVARWVPTDERDSKYHIYPDQYASFSPPDARGSNPIVSDPPAGLGYFIRLPKQCTLNIGTLGTLNDQYSYNIRLLYGTQPPRGWNLIGNPYDAVVDWGTVGFEADGQRYDLREAMSDDVGITEGVLFDFISTSTGGYYQFSADPAQDVMDFMRGYWVHVLRDATLVVYNPSVSEASAKRSWTAAAKRAPTKDEWTLKLSAYSGEFQDPVNYIGVHPKGSQGYDIGLDLGEPPALSSGIALYMPQQEDWGSRAGHYVRDIRSSLAARQEWNVEVSTELSQVPVTLTWGDINSSVPEGVRLTLRDLDADRDVYMRTTTAYTFRTGDGPETRHLKVIATVEQSGALAVSSLNTAGASDGGVMISFALTRSASVEADIRNIAGIPIARLAPVEAAGGVSRTMTWNGRSHTGAKVPNGKYLVRVTACTAEGQTVQAIALFDKTR